MSNQLTAHRAPSTDILKGKSGEITDFFMADMYSDDETGMYYRTLPGEGRFLLKDGQGLAVCLCNCLCQMKICVHVIH